MEEKPFEEAVRDQCTYWQGVLRLQDWNIQCDVVRAHEMKGDRSPVAQCESYIRRKDAMVRVLHPMDLPAVSPYFLNGEEKDYDLSLVHELLHLHFAPFQAEVDTAADLAQEQAIESISRAITKLYRELKAKDTTTLEAAEAAAEERMGLYA